VPKYLAGCEGAFYFCNHVQSTFMFARSAAAFICYILDILNHTFVALRGSGSYRVKTTDVPLVSSVNSRKGTSTTIYALRPWKGQLREVRTSFTQRSTCLHMQPIHLRRVCNGLQMGKLLCAPKLRCISWSVISFSCVIALTLCVPDTRTWRQPRQCTGDTHTGC
jgi:hypothetical protein